MEWDYHEAQKQLDTKLYIAFGLVTLIGVLLSGIFILFFTTKETLDYIFLSVQLGLSLFGLLIRNQLPAISKIVILSALPLSFSRHFKLIFSAFSESHPARYYAFGICVGIAQATLSTNFRGLKQKIFLLFGLMIVNICANIDGFINVVNFSAIFAVIALLLASFIYQEILVRKDYKAVYESQEKLQKFKSLLSDDFPIGVLIMSAIDLSVLYSNKFFNQNFEEDRQKIKNSTFKEFELEIDPSELGLSLSHQINEDDPLYFSEFVKDLNKNSHLLDNQNMLVLPAVYRSSKDDSSPSHYEIKIRLTIWDQVPAYAIVFNDVSEKQLVTALKMADQQKDRIIATVSHELRTPINGTLGLLDMIGARITDSVSQTYLDYCRSCNKLLLYLVNSILDLSQLTEDKFRLTQTRFGLDELLDEVKSLYLYQCQQKSIDFRIEKDISIPSEIYTDKHRLIQVLINLISNAIKFTFQGSVTLKIERNPEDPWRLKFSVIDTGIGIKEEDKTRLFQRFGKIPQANSNINIQGVGLGLAIVQELVVALNFNDKDEKIYLESEYEKGSVFSFYVPWKERISLKRVSQHEEKPADLGSEGPVFPKEMEISFDSVELKLKKYDSKNSTGHKLLGSSYKSLLKSIQKSEVQKNVEEDKLKVQNVLIVDDNPFNILAASFVLEKLHCSIDKAFHGEECINLLQKQEKLYDLILMDIQMPVMDGVQASKIITEKVKAGELKNVPIVALTAKKSTEEEKKYYEDCGILAVLEKPLNGKKLMSTIESISSRSH